MRTLLVILSYPKANGIVRRHWPWYQKAGCDIYGIGTEGAGCWWPDVHAGWPEPCFVGHADIGRDSYVSGDHLPRKFCDVLLHLIYARSLNEYDRYVIMEPDAIFTEPIPKLPSHPFFMAHIAGGPQPGFHGKKCLHGPWCMSKKTAFEMYHYGQRMLRAGLIEGGFPDYFLGLMVDLYPDINFISTEGTFSVNLIDRPAYLQAARACIARGGYWYLHGIKTEQQLMEVTTQLVHP